jgi:heptosyltransferase-2
MKKRIVVLAPNWLGDAVMALPALRDIRRHVPEANLSVAARASVAALFHAVPEVDEILILSPGRGRSARRNDIRKLKKGRFDLAILFPNSFHSAWMIWRAGVPERWGYRSDLRGRLLTRAVARPRPKVHFGEYYLALVRGLGMETGPPTPRIVVAAAGADAAAQMLRARGWVSGELLVGVAPGAAYGHAKRWPPERFAALISVLSDEAGASCVLLGRAEDRDAGQEVEAALHAQIPNPESQIPRVINLIGATDLPKLMGVISHCRALVANDSGALHLAAAMGVPVTAIYGPTDERFSTPLTAREADRDRVAVIFEPVWCRPCFLRDCPIDHRCMTRIPVSRVADAVRAQLQLGPLTERALGREAARGVGAPQAERPERALGPRE